MPGSSTSIFNDAEDFEAASREEGCLSLVVIGCGQFRARLTQVALLHVRLSTTNEQLPRVAFVGVPDEMALISFPIGRGIGPVYGGLRLSEGEITIVPPGQHMHVRTDGLCHWGAIWVPVEELIRYVSALTGAPFTVPSTSQNWRPLPAAIEHLRALHVAVTRIAETRPRALADAEAAHALEQQVFEALVTCVAIVPENAGITATRRHQDIMVGFERLLQAQPHRNMPMTEISRALGVSDRLLRNLCAEHLGMNGNRYLRLCRMSLVHRALRRGGCDAVNVSVVARLYGFSELGRFAAGYRAMFGELPSATLRRGSDRQISTLSCVRRVSTNERCVTRSSK